LLGIAIFSENEIVTTPIIDISLIAPVKVVDMDLVSILE
jgi:hypothetical protein